VPDLITSPKNAIVGRFRAAGTGDADALFLVEGRKLIEEAIEAGLSVVEAAFDVEREEPLRPLIERLRQARAMVYPCAPSVCGKLSFVTTPQGIAAVFAKPARDDTALLGTAPALLVIAAGVKEPGNLGALLRAGEAAGATGMIALRGGADAFREKAVRGAAGSLFRLPVRSAESAHDALAFVQTHGLALFVAEANGDVDYLAADLRHPCALVLGGEGEGIPDQLRAAARARLRVPMAGKVDSLNVAVAAGVLLYEARRQRRA
jgi:TrmH family RNA methyltransferase